MLPSSGGASVCQGVPHWHTQSTLDKSLSQEACVGVVVKGKVTAADATAETCRSVRLRWVWRKYVSRLAVMQTALQIRSLYRTGLRTVKKGSSRGTSAKVLSRSVTLLRLLRLWTFLDGFPFSRTYSFSRLFFDWPSRGLFFLLLSRGRLLSFCPCQFSPLHQRSVTAAAAAAAAAAVAHSSVGQSDSLFFSFANRSFTVAVLQWPSLPVLFYWSLDYNRLRPDGRQERRRRKKKKRTWCRCSAFLARVVVTKPLMHWPA